MLYCTLGGKVFTYSSKINKLINNTLGTKTKCYLAMLGRKFPLMMLVEASDIITGEALKYLKVFLALSFDLYIYTCIWKCQK